MMVLNIILAVTISTRPRVYFEDEDVLVASITSSLKRMFESVPNLQVKLSDIVAEGNNVYVTAISKGEQYFLRKFCKKPNNFCEGKSI